MKMLVLTIDPDMAGHLAVALRRHRSALAKHRLTEPPALADLETALLEVSKRQEAPHSDTVGVVTHHGLDDRECLTRNDVSQLAGVSTRTVDRWLSTGRLPSIRHGRIRRIRRADLDRFLGAAT